MSLASQRCIKILIVEDEILLGKSLSNKLKKLGYDVVDFVTSGEDAIQTVASQKPDLVIMDIVIQGQIDGIEAATEIFKTYNVHVIFLTAYVDDKMILRAEHSGAYGYILKPFNTQGLDAAIRVAMRKHDQQTEILASLDLAEELSTKLQCAIKKTSLRMSGRGQAVTLEADLHQALEKAEFYVYYQPLICLRSRIIVGAEALLRWQHPLKGMISPTVFIPLAEKNQLVGSIGNWVLQQACKQAQTWQNLSPHPVKVAVNLSPRQVQQASVTDTIEKILTLTNLPANLLTLEITENALMEENSSLIQTIHDLKSLNIQLSIDDFGTGYSSLNYLQRFPFDILKIDRSFIQSCAQSTTNSAIVNAIIQLSENLSLDTVAEGVEIPEEAEFLRKRNCNLAQGYLFSPPLPATEFQEFLASYKLPEKTLS